MKNCPQCHESYPPDLFVCPEDGSLLEDFDAAQPGDAISSISLAEFAPADIAHDEPLSPTALAVTDQQPEVIFSAEPVPDLHVETPSLLLGGRGTANDVDVVAPPELPLSDVPADEPKVLGAQTVTGQANQPLSVAPTENLSGVQIPLAPPAPQPRGRVPSPSGAPTRKNRSDQPPEKSSVQSLFGTQIPKTRPDRPQEGRRVRAGLIPLAVIVLVSAGSWLVIRKTSSVRVQPGTSPSSQPGLGSSSAPNPAPPAATPVASSETATSSTSTPIPSPAPATPGLGSSSAPNPAPPAASPVTSGETATSSTSIPIPSPPPATPTLVPGGGAAESVKAEPKAPPRGPKLRSAKRAETPARKLSPAESAELKDKLVLALFFMERNDYAAAVGAFQAALKIDPTNRGAQEGIRRARKARDAQRASTRP